MMTIMQDMDMLIAWAGGDNGIPEEDEKRVWGYLPKITALFTIVDDMVQEELNNNKRPSDSVIKAWLDGAAMLGFHRGLPDPDDFFAEDDSYFDASLFDTPKGRFAATERVILTRDTVFHIHVNEGYTTTFEAGSEAKFLGYQDGRYSLAITDPWGGIATVDAEFFRRADDES